MQLKVKRTSDGFFQLDFTKLTREHLIAFSEAFEKVESEQGREINKTLNNALLAWYRFLR